MSCKSELRKIYLKKRASLTEALRDLYSLQIANQSLNLPIWKQKTYHIFLPIAKFNEINTEYILHILFGKDKNIVISKTNIKAHTLTHYLLTDQTRIEVNTWGIPEPVEGIEIAPTLIDVVFVPLLAFDKKGNRIGYGKGFYDDFLSQCRSDTLKIGLSFFGAESEISDVSATDIGLDYCITPQKIYKF